jgi:hypothetical protein
LLPTIEAVSYSTTSETSLWRPRFYQAHLAAGNGTAGTGHVAQPEMLALRFGVQAGSFVKSGRYIVVSRQQLLVIGKVDGTGSAVNGKGAIVSSLTSSL